MNATLAIPTECSAYRLTPVGIEFLGDLDQQEWAELGGKLGTAGRSVGFLIGDWLNYGEAKGPRFYGAKEDENGEKPNIYSSAMRITGLDYKTLSDFASVSRKVEFPLRNGNLAFEHHKKIAPLKTDEEKRKWLQVAEKERAKQDGKPMSARRLAKSILLGRVAKPEEMQVPASDRGVDNPHPHINRLIAWWGKRKREGFLENGYPDQFETLLEDLAPVLKMAEEIREALASYEGDAR